MFRLIRALVKKGEVASPTVDDPDLGQLTYSDDDESWFGQYGQQAFSLAYDGAATPSALVRSYAITILGKPSWLSHTLALAKADALTTYSPFYAAEIEALALGTIHFYVSKKRKPRIIADLTGGLNYRLWRIEYADGTCEGIGFDN